MDIIKRVLQFRYRLFNSKSFSPEVLILLYPTVKFDLPQHFSFHYR